MDIKPFLLLQSRPEAEVAENEYQAFLKFGGLEPHQLKRIAMDRDGLPPIDLDAYSAIILGGGPSNVTDPESKKSPFQKRYEPALLELIREIIKRDYPFLGACLGIGFVSAALDGVMSHKYWETVMAATITLTPDGQTDPLTQGLPPQFDAFVGHKEACEVLPSSAVLLASSATCPVQMFRVGQNVYATQFHPELDSTGLALRIEAYKHLGYFEPSEAGTLTAMAHAANITVPKQILRRFIERYAITPAGVSNSA
jgi:GMP synthase (glutamine-hydrolysing)